MRPALALGLGLGLHVTSAVLYVIFIPVLLLSWMPFYLGFSFSVFSLLSPCMHHNAALAHSALLLTALYYLSALAPHTSVYLRFASSSAPVSLCCS